MTDSKPEMINEFVTVGDKGFYRVEGPFDLEQSDGTVWSVSMPIDEEDYAGIDSGTASILAGSEGRHAVAIADGKAVAGGRVVEAYRPEGEDSLHVLVDQYYDGEVA